MKQDLRDKLLKAGLVDKKAKKRADHRARIERTDAKKKGVDEEKEEEKKAREYEEKEEKRRREDKERELARHQEQLKRDKKFRRERRALDLLKARMFMPKSSGPVAFNFVARSGGIRKIQVTTGIARDLNNGQLAIAQLPGGERFGLVRRDVAEQLLADDPSLVRFFVSDPQEDMVEVPPVVVDEFPKKKSTKRFELPGKSKGDRRDR